MFGLLRYWRRRRNAARPFPEAWLAILERHVPFFERLQGEERKRFLILLKCFVWEKEFFGAGSMEIDDDVRVVVAATAVRLVLHLGLSRYDRCREIVIYPGAYQHPESETVVLGEAHTFGTVVLSWNDVLLGLQNPRDGHDTASHEFAHVLDRASGAFDGTPDLRAREDYRHWAEIMSHHYLGLRARGRQQREVLRRYGATNEAEFFAVATEAFFEKSEQMLESTPDLYAALSRFYGADPATDRRDA